MITWIRTLILFASLIVGVAAFEFLILPFSLPHLPLKIQWRFPRDIQTLSQTSKRHWKPAHYVAILGDSYAQGLGDWFRGANLCKNPNYYSGHVIHERTGRDVVTFGHSGAGSLEGVVGTPLSRLRHLSHYWFGLKSPDVVLIYFYEGNDLDDNLLDLRKRFDRRWDKRRLEERAYFQEFIRKDVAKESEKTHFFLTSRLLSERGKTVRGQGTYGEAMAEWRDAANNEPGETNKIFLDGVATAVPDALQSPSLELTVQEAASAARVFEQALIFLRNRLPHSRCGVVYIPSPLSCYSLASRRVSIETYHNRSSIYSSYLVARRSDDIFELIRQASERNSVPVLDSRPIFRQACRSRLLHGPVDWRHLNKEGQEILGAAVAAFLPMMDRL